MSVEILEKFNEPLLSRVCVKARAGFEGVTPSRLKLRKDLAKALKVDEEKVIVKHVYTHYGGFSADVEAFVYDDRKVAEAVEHKKLLEKHPLKADKESSAESGSSEEKAAESSEAVADEASADDSADDVKSDD